VSRFSSLTPAFVKTSADKVGGYSLRFHLRVKTHSFLAKENHAHAIQKFRKPLKYAI
jgi:hypothetical protein